MSEKHEHPSAYQGEARRQRFQSGIRAVVFGLVSNLVLIGLKGSAGVLGHSEALLADAIHSAADLVNSLVVLASLFISRRPADPTHPYGHGRAEALSATFASFVIGVAGLLVAWDSIGSLRTGQHEPPALLALWVAGAALLIKLVLAIYAGRVARRIRSKAVYADARDHLNDVIASSFVVLGVLIARLGYPLFDPLAGLLVAGFIVFTAFEIFREAARELMDTSLSAPVCDAILARVEKVHGVSAVSGIAGRTLADSTLVEIHIDVDPAMSVADGGRIVDEIKRQLIGRVPGVNHVVVEMNSDMAEPEALQVSQRRSRH